MGELSPRGLLGASKIPVACEEAAISPPLAFSLVRFVARRIELGLSNGKGIRAEMKDGAITAYRAIASTPASPAVEIDVRKPNEDWNPTKSILRRKGE